MVKEFMTRRFYSAPENERGLLLHYPIGGSGKPEKEISTYSPRRFGNKESYPVPVPAQARRNSRIIAVLDYFQ